MLDRFRFAVQTTIFACFLVSKVLGGCSEAESDATAFDESRAVAEVTVLAAGPYLAADGSRSVSMAMWSWNPRLAVNSWTLRRMRTLYQSSVALTFDFVGNPLPTKEFYRLVTGP